MLKLEFLSVTPGVLEGYGLCFSTLMSPVPISWDSRVRNCLQSAPDLDILSSQTAGSRGRKNVHLLTSSAPCCKSDCKAAARSRQPLLSLCLLRGPLVSVPLREQLMRSGLQFWGAARPYSSNSFSRASWSNRELPRHWRALTAKG